MTALVHDDGVAPRGLARVIMVITSTSKDMEFLFYGTTGFVITHVLRVHANILS
jgi:hypothetical protein